MPFRSFLQRQIACILLVGGSAISSQSGAMFSGYDASAIHELLMAQVILKDDVPCFFSTAMTEEDKGARQRSITVEPMQGKIAWHISEDRGSRPLPASADQCVKYGETWQAGKILAEPKPLQYGMPYLVDFGARYHYLGIFCLSRDSTGATLLTQWSMGEDIVCTETPLNRPSKNPSGT
jgi:hypothetical protein